MRFPSRRDLLRGKTMGSPGRRRTEGEPGGRARQRVEESSAHPFPRSPSAKSKRPGPAPAAGDALPWGYTLRPSTG